MNLYSCSQESELAAALREHRWPDGCPPELRAHAEACPHCQDLLLVSQTLQQARRQAMPMADLASPGLLWWRSQIRQRNQAVERAAKPIAVAEALAIAGTLLVAAVLAYGQRADFLHALSGFVDLSLSSPSLRDAWWPASGGAALWALLASSAASIGVLGGVAVWLTVRAERGK